MLRRGPAPSSSPTITEQTATTTVVPAANPNSRRSPAASLSRRTGLARLRAGRQAQIRHRPRLQREVAGHLRGGSLLALQGRLDRVAGARLEARAARMEPACRRRVDWARHVTLEHDRLAGAGRARVRDRDGREQRPRVRMLRMLVEVECRADLDDLA